MRTSQNRAETTAVGRLVLKPAAWFDLGGSYSQGDVVAEPETPGFDTSPKGLDGTSGTGYRFFPGVYVNGRRQRWGVDARLQGGPVAVWGEFLEAREERKGQGPTLEDLPDVRGRGWSATATWLVTGERKTRTIRPRRRLFEGPGAIELAARYEELWFDDVSNEGFEAAGTRCAQHPTRRAQDVHREPELVADEVPALPGQRAGRALRRRAPGARARQAGKLRLAGGPGAGAPAVSRAKGSLVAAAWRGSSASPRSARSSRAAAAAAAARAPARPPAAPRRAACRRAARRSSTRPCCTRRGSTSTRRPGRRCATTTCRTSTTPRTSTSTAPPSRRSAFARAAKARATRRSRG